MALKEAHEFSRLSRVDACHGEGFTGLQRNAVGLLVFANWSLRVKSALAGLFGARSDTARCIAGPEHCGVHRGVQQLFGGPQAPKDFARAAERPASLGLAHLQCVRDWRRTGC
jgi:hypothetical protein